MSDVVEISVALLRKFAEFTKKLTPEQVAGVASGELKFGLLDSPVRKAVAPKAVARKAPPLDVEQLRIDLNTMTSREVASSHIDSFRLGAPALKDLAKSLGASLVGRGRTIFGTGLLSTRWDTG
jgi:hypothetical protein